MTTDTQQPAQLVLTHPQRSFLARAKTTWDSELPRGMGPGHPAKAGGCRERHFPVLNV